METYEVYNMKFYHYHGSTEYEFRPALIINDKIIEIEDPEKELKAIKMTGTNRSDSYIEYPLKYWKYAGCTKPTTVRLESLYQPIKAGQLKKENKRGNLHPVDIANIRRIMEKYQDRMGTRD